jgi:hypothetical protein
MTGEIMLRDPGPQQIEPLAEAAPGTRCTLMKLTSRTCRWPIGDPKKGISAFAALPLCGDGRIASFISESHIMRRRNESNRGQAQDRARPAARRGRISRFKAEAARRDSDG